MSGPAVTERYLKSRTLLLGYLKGVRAPHVLWKKPEDRTHRIKTYQQHLAIIRQQELGQ